MKHKIHNNDYIQTEKKALDASIVQAHKCVEYNMSVMSLPTVPLS